ncbi:hypothetical protein GQR58_010237 [Nymphon striatum]|nr:hypothetical protein GQR58_010237 [Nymphon striatum]
MTQARRSRKNFKSRIMYQVSNVGYIFTIISYLIGVFIFATIVAIYRLCDKQKTKLINRKRDIARNALQYYLAHFLTSGLFHVSNFINIDCIGDSKESTTKLCAFIKDMESTKMTDMLATQYCSMFSTPLSTMQTIDQFMSTSSDADTNQYQR